MTVTKQDLNQYLRIIESYLTLDDAKEKLSEDDVTESFLLNDTDVSEKAKFEQTLIERMVIIDHLSATSLLSANSPDIPRINKPLADIKTYGDIEPYLTELQNHLADPEAEQRFFATLMRSSNNSDEFTVQRDDAGSITGVERHTDSLFGIIQNNPMDGIEFTTIAGQVRNLRRDLPVILDVTKELNESAGKIADFAPSDPRADFLSNLDHNTKGIMAFKMQLNEFAQENNLPEIALTHSDGSVNTDLNSDLLSLQDQYLQSMASTLRSMASILEKEDINYSLPRVRANETMGFDDTMRHLKDHGRDWNSSAFAYAGAINNLEGEIRQDFIAQLIDRNIIPNASEVEISQFLDHFEAQTETITQYINTDHNPHFDNALTTFKHFLVQEQEYNGKGGRAKPPYVYDPDLTDNPNDAGFGFALTRLSLDLEQKIEITLSEIHPDDLAGIGISMDEINTDGQLTDREIEIYRTLLDNGVDFGSTPAEISKDQTFIRFYEAAQARGDIAPAQNAFTKDFEGQFAALDIQGRDFARLILTGASNPDEAGRLTDEEKRDKIDTLTSNHAGRELFFSIKSLEVLRSEEAFERLDVLNTPEGLAMLGHSAPIMPDLETRSQPSYVKTMAQEQMVAFLNTNAANNGLGNTTLTTDTLDFADPQTPASQAMLAELHEIQDFIATFDFKNGELNPNEPLYTPGSNKSLFTSMPNESKTGEDELKAIRKAAQNGQITPDLFSFLERLDKTMHQAPEGYDRGDTDLHDAYRKATILGSANDASNAQRYAEIYQASMFSSQGQDMLNRAKVLETLFTALPEDKRVQVVTASNPDNILAVTDLKTLFTSYDTNVYLLGTSYPAQSLNDLVLFEDFTAQDSNNNADIFDFTRVYRQTVSNIQTTLELENTGILDADTLAAAQNSTSLNDVQLQFIETAQRLTDAQRQNIENLPKRVLQSLPLSTTTQETYAELKTAAPAIVDAILGKNSPTIRNLSPEMRELIAQLPDLDNDGRLKINSNAYLLREKEEKLSSRDRVHFAEVMTEYLTTLQSANAPDDQSLLAMRIVEQAVADGLIQDSNDLGVPGLKEKIAASNYGRGGVDLSTLSGDFDEQTVAGVHDVIQDAQSTLSKNGSSIINKINFELQTDQDLNALILLTQIPEIGILHQEFVYNTSLLANGAITPADYNTYIQGLGDDGLHAIKATAREFIENAPQNGFSDATTTLIAQITLASGINTPEINTAIYNINYSFNGLSMLPEEEVIAARTQMLEDEVIPDFEQALTSTLSAGSAVSMIQLVNTAFAAGQGIDDNYQPSGSLRDPDFVNAVGKSTEFFQQTIAENAALLAEVTGKDAELFASTPRTGQWGGNETAILSLLQENRAQLYELKGIEQLLEIGRLRTNLSNVSYDVDAQIRVYQLMGPDFTIPDTFTAVDATILDMKHTLAALPGHPEVWTTIPQLTITDESAFNATDPGFIETLNAAVKQIQTDMRNIGRSNPLDPEGILGLGYLSEAERPAFEKKIRTAIIDTSFRDRIFEIEESLSADDLSDQDREALEANKLGLEQYFTLPESQRYEQGRNILDQQYFAQIESADIATLMDMAFQSGAILNQKGTPLTQEEAQLLLVQYRIGTIANVGNDKAGALGPETLAHIDTYIAYTQHPNFRDPQFKARAAEFSQIIAQYAQLTPEKRAELDSAMSAAAAPAPGVVNFDPNAPPIDEELERQLGLAKEMLINSAEQLGFEVDPVAIEDPRELTAELTAQYQIGFEGFMTEFFEDEDLQNIVFGYQTDDGTFYDGDDNLRRFRYDMDADGKPDTEFRLQPDGNILQYRMVENQNGYAFLDHDEDGKPYNTPDASPDKKIQYMSRVNADFLQKILLHKSKQATGLDEPLTDIDTIDREIKEREESLRTQLRASFVGDPDFDVDTWTQEAKTNQDAFTQRLRDKGLDGGKIDSITSYLYQMESLNEIRNLALMQDMSDFISSGFIPDGTVIDSPPTLHEPWKTNWNDSTYKNENGSLRLEALSNHRIHDPSIYAKLNEDTLQTTDFDDNALAARFIENQHWESGAMSEEQFNILTRYLMVAEAAQNHGITDYESDAAKRAFLEDYNDKKFHPHDLDYLRRAGTADGTDREAGLMSHMNAQHSAGFDEFFGFEDAIADAHGNVIVIENTTLPLDLAVQYFMRMNIMREPFGYDFSDQDYTMTYADLIEKHGDERVAVFGADENGDIIERNISEQIAHIMRTVSLDDFYQTYSMDPENGDFKGQYERGYKAQYDEMNRANYAREHDLTLAPELPEPVVPLREHYGADTVNPNEPFIEDPPTDQASRANELKENSGDLATPDASVIDAMTGQNTPDPSRYIGAPGYRN